jgi:hypothetical protein
MNVAGKVPRAEQQLPMDRVEGFAGEFDALVSVLEKFRWLAHDPPLGPRTVHLISTPKRKGVNRVPGYQLSKVARCSRPTFECTS